MPNMLRHIDYFSTGTCSNQLSLMFKQVKNRKIVFPAGVFLLEHEKLGYILYDTGYSAELNAWQPKYLLYRLANPIQVKQEDEIDQQLSQRGIAPEAIRYVILSHLHPDHIGRVKAFPNATFIVTSELYEAYQHRTAKDLIFTEFLPADFEDRLKIVAPYREHPAFPYVKTADLFHDGSVLLTSLGGHAPGQACLFLPAYHLFIAADVAWGIDLLPYTPQIRRLPLQIQHDKKQYFQHIDLLKRILADGVDVLVSHDPEERVRQVLDGK